MRLLKYLRMVLRKPPELPKYDRETIREMERETVSRFSRGNVRLQLGEYVTREDLDNEMEQIKGLRFDER